MGVINSFDACQGRIERDANEFIYFAKELCIIWFAYLFLLVFQ